MRRLLLLLLLFLLGPAWAAQSWPLIEPFRAGSLPSLIAREDGRPFLLVFWSLECAPCRAKLPALARALRKRPDVGLVLVSVDAPEMAAEVARTLRRLGLRPDQTWIFADPVPERLREEVDPAWRGEVPRSYLFREGRRLEALTGVPDASRLAAWLAADAHARP